MKILDKNNYGLISKCECCDEVQFQFGTCILTFTKEEFFEFDEFFDEIRKDIKHVNCNDNDKRQYIVKTTRNNTILYLSFNELKAAISLVTNAMLLLSLNDMIEVK
ncbi:MAG TPA: DUF6686 family protein [Vicingaceae bacterium]|nr:DUF6686 family protein [Vicingaceae bacterium]